MNESQHTPGPAILVPGYDGMIALGERPEDADHCVKMFNAMTHRLDPEDIANARRIAACWNVCQGIPTETLEAGRCKMILHPRKRLISYPPVMGRRRTIT